MSGLFYELVVASIYEGVIAVVVLEPWALQGLCWLARDASSSRPISLGITSILCIPGHEPYIGVAEAEKRSDVVQHAARAHNCRAVKTGQEMRTRV